MAASKSDLICKISRTCEIEKIIWAYSGVKRCSQFAEPRDDKGSVLSVINSLGLEYDRKCIKVKGWPSWETFAREHPTDGQYRGDLAAGLFYDIPYCCAQAYQKLCTESHDRFFKEYPFKGMTNDREVMKRDFKDELELLSFYTELRKHQEIHQFSRKFDLLEELYVRVSHLVLSGKLSRSYVLLLGQTYVPCKPGCEEFLCKARNMLESIEKQLGSEEARHILRKYEEATISSRKTCLE